jgi:CubicO group peptidase (beta-lactamase class C family)
MTSSASALPRRIRSSRAAARLAAGALVAAAAALGYFLLQLGFVGAGFAAKQICSGVFVSARSAEDVLAHEIALNDPGILRFVRADVDAAARRVQASFLGVRRQEAVFRDGLGCTLTGGAMPVALAPPASSPAPPLAVGVLPPPVAARLARAVDAAFVEPQNGPRARTRAVVVLHDGRLVAERYAPGYGADTPLPGWSMAKSVLNALAGVLVREGRLALDDPVPVPAWRGAGDPRGAITLRQLLQMESGLAFSENYANPLDDVVWMLFASRDAAGYAAAKPLERPPGSAWAYSSGTSNIVSRVMREALGSDAEYAAFPRRALFAPLGMASAVMEPDAAGNYVASSYVFATARDWARFGQLYLDDGVAGGRRLLPEGWVAFSASPARHAPDAAFGAHFWLKVPREFANGARSNEGLPPGTFHAVGFEGQFVSVVPQRRLVVVRLGLASGEGAWNHLRFLNEVVAAFAP